MPSPPRPGQRPLQTRPWSHLGWSTERELAPAPSEEVRGPWDGHGAVVGRTRLRLSTWLPAGRTAVSPGPAWTRPPRVLPTGGAGVAGGEKATAAHG